MGKGDKRKTRENIAILELAVHDLRGFATSMSSVLEDASLNWVDKGEAIDALATAAKARADSALREADAD